MNIHKFALSLSDNCSVLPNRSLYCSLSGSRSKGQSSKLFANNHSSNVVGGGIL